MNSWVAHAFSRELEKLALGVKHVVEPGLMQRGILAMYRTPEMLQADPAQAVKQFVEKNPSKGLLLTTPREEVKAYMEAIGKRVGHKVTPQHVDAVMRSMKRHELTHYLQTRRGQKAMQPGIRGVLRTAAMEAEAIKGGYKPISKLPLRSRLGYIGTAPLGVAQNVSLGYRPLGGVRKALLGGTLGRLGEAARTGAHILRRVARV